MALFEYQAETSAGERTSGQLNAAGIEQARQLLLARGLTAIEVLPVAGTSVGRLSSSEAEALVGHIADLSNTGAPLAAGLRAAAAESSSRQLAASLTSIAERLELGVPCEKIFEDPSLRLPGHVRGLVAAAARTGRLGLALDELVEHHRAARAIWFGVAASISYPLLVLGLTVALLSFFPLYIVPHFKSMFVEFGLELPVITQWLIHASDMLMWVIESGRWVLTGGCALLLAAVILLATGWGGGAVQRFLATAPFVGPLWHWSGTASGSRLLAILLEHGVPLPEALRLTAGGIRNGNVRETFRWLADGVERGSSLSELLQSTSRLPASLVPLVRWGEKSGELADALRDASEMFLSRIRLRAALLRSVSPSIVFVLVFLFAGFTIVALFMPLFSLIQGLS